MCVENTRYARHVPAREADLLVSSGLFSPRFVTEIHSPHPAPACNGPMVHVLHFIDNFLSTCFHVPIPSSWAIL